MKIASVLIVTLSLVCCFATPANAQTAEDIEACASFGYLADIVLDARNNGTPQTAVMQQILLSLAEEEDQEFADIIAPVYLNLVREAYALPQMTTPPYQQEQKAAFRAYVESSCFSAIQNQ